MFVRAKITVVLLSALVVAYGFLGGLVKTSAVGNDIYRDLTTFMEVLDKVRHNYVEEPEMREAVEGALQGMIESLDPFSSYVGASTYRELSEVRRMDGTPGLILSKRSGYMIIVSVAAGSPAEEQGLRNGDLLESIDGRSTSEMSLWEAESRLRGQVGSQVELRLTRARRVEASSVRLTRGKASKHDASVRFEEDGIGVLHVPHLEKGMAQSVRSKLLAMRDSGLKGLVIDLRRTALGEWDEAVAISDYFLTSGQRVMSLRDRHGKEEVFTAQLEPLLSDLPLLVLVDSGTSGAAEALAAALQDAGVAECLGERSNGQGGVQESFRLQDGSVLIFSTKRVIRPSGEPIFHERPRKAGIKPDLRWPNQDFVTNFYYDNIPEDSSGDPGEGFYRRLTEEIEKEQLRKAFEKIRESLLKKKAA